MPNEAVRHRSAGSPGRRPALHHRPRLLSRRHRSAAPSPRFHAALAACPCPDRIDRPRGGARRARCGRRLHRRRPGAGRHRGHPCLSAVTNRDGSQSVLPPHPAIARDRVRHVGDTVAMVVADTAAAARDAAELVAVEYDPLPAVVDTGRALDPGQPPVWDEAPGNLCFDWEIGDRAAVERAAAGARHRIASSSSTTASSSIRWSRAARSANTIRARRPTPCGARPRARISSAICSPPMCSRSRRTASASSPATLAAGSA